MLVRVGLSLMGNQFSYIALLLLIRSRWVAWWCPQYSRIRRLGRSRGHLKFIPYFRDFSVDWLQKCLPVNYLVALVTFVCQSFDSIRTNLVHSLDYNILIQHHSDFLEVNY